MDPDRTIDLCLCYGASVAVAVGVSLAPPGTPVFCVTGDAAFLHTGVLALEEGRSRGARVVVIVLDNGVAVSTGGQRIPARVRVPPEVPIIPVTHTTATANTYRELLARLIAQPGMTVLHVSC